MTLCTYWVWLSRNDKISSVSGDTWDASFLFQHVSVLPYSASTRCCYTKVSFSMMTPRTSRQLYCFWLLFLTLGICTCTTKGKNNKIIIVTTSLCDCIDYGTVDLIQCQAVVALVGQAVFHGRIYKTVHGMDFRLEFIVSGSDIKQVGIVCHFSFPY